MFPATLPTGQVDLLLVCRQPKAGPRRPWCITRALPEVAVSGGPNLRQGFGKNQWLHQEDHLQTLGFPHLYVYVSLPQGNQQNWGIKPTIIWDINGYSADVVGKYHLLFGLSQK
jgi:hypothetical protein